MDPGYLQPIVFLELLSMAWLKQVKDLGTYLITDGIEQKAGCNCNEKMDKRNLVVKPKGMPPIVVPDGQRRYFIFDELPHESESPNEPENYLTWRTFYGFLCGVLSDPFL